MGIKGNHIREHTSKCKGLRRRDGSARNRFERCGPGQEVNVQSLTSGEVAAHTIRHTTALHLHRAGVLSRRRNGDREHALICGLVPWGYVSPIACRGDSGVGARLLRAGKFMQSSQTSRGFFRHLAQQDLTGGDLSTR